MIYTKLSAALLVLLPAVLVQAATDKEWKTPALIDIGPCRGLRLIKDRPTFLSGKCGSKDVEFDLNKCLTNRDGFLTAGGGDFAATCNPWTCWMEPDSNYACDCSGKLQSDGRLHKTERGSVLLNKAIKGDDQGLSCA